MIGAALVAKATGHGHRRVAADLGVHPSTVRGWLRRFAASAKPIRSFFTVLAHHLDPLLAAVTRFGPRRPWAFASAVSAGALLSNTSCPWAGAI